MSMPESCVSIVIIDDNAGSLELLSAALETDGVRILTAADPEEGLDIVFQEHPQIVLTDLVMPGLSGLDVLDRIVEFDPAIDVILMTAHSTTESAVEAIRKGACDYLQKPVSISMLRERVSKLVEEARRRYQGSILENWPPGSAASPSTTGQFSSQVKPVRARISQPALCIV
jgi:DNA-binding NtrC family response regulator